MLADFDGEFLACFEGGLEAAIGKAQVAPPVETENLRRRSRFAGPDLGRAERCRFAVGQLEDPDPLS